MAVHFGDRLVVFLLALISTAIGITNIVACVRIVQRAGYSGWWTLVMFVPVLNMAAMWYFAFWPWPAETSKTASQN